MNDDPEVARLLAELDNLGRLPEPPPMRKRWDPLLRRWVRPRREQALVAVVETDADGRMWVDGKRVEVRREE